MRKFHSAIPLTTDFLVHLHVRNRNYWIALAYKPTDILSEPARTPHRVRDCNKLRLEQRYWDYFQVPWRLLVEKDIDRTEVYNLQFFAEARQLPNISESTIHQFLRTFNHHWSATPLAPLRELIDRTARTLNLSFLNGLRFFKYVAWHRMLSIDLRQRVELYLPLPRAVS